MATRLYKVGTVSVTNGSNIVTGSGTNWANASDKPQAGDLFSLDLDKLYEITAITNTQITLDRNFAGTTQSGVNYSIVRHSSAGDIQSLNLAISNLINNRESFVDSLDDVVSGDADEVTHVNRFNQSKQIPTLKKARDDYAAVQAQAESLVGSVVLPTKADFESRYEGKYAGAGFVEWGTEDGISFGGIVELSETSANNNQLSIGTNGTDDNYSEVYLSGSKIRLHTVARADGLLQHGRSFIKYPSAPDGLDKADGTGRFASLAEAITAGGDSLSASVIHRQDLCILEVFDVNITTSGLPLYPYGSCQYGGSWSGITLADNLVAQGYSAFHVGDTTTKGKGFLPDLTNDNHVKFIQDKINNCYRNHLGEIIQRQYRIRTIAGLEGAWRLDEVETFNSAGYGLRFKTSANKFVQPQGIKTTPPSWGLEYTDAVYYNKTTALANSPTRDRASDSHYVVQFGGAGHTSSEIAHNGNCWAIPIALVQRRNKGAYHPYNIAGSKSFHFSDGTGANKWYKTQSKKPLSVSDCFDAGSDYSTSFVYLYSGRIQDVNSWQKGRDDEKCYDAIYASDVLDLRLSARKVNAEVTANNDAKKAIGGTKRGWEAQPFTQFITETVTTNSIASYDSTNSGGTITFPTSASDLPQGQNNKVFEYKNATHWILVGDNGNSMKIKRNGSGTNWVYWPYGNVGNHVYLYNSGDVRAEFNSKFPIGTVLKIGAQWNIPYYQAEPTWTDIIAKPAVFEAVFPDGACGSWIPIVPNSTSKRADLTRKKTSMVGLIYTVDDGDTWVTTPSTAFNNEKNYGIGSFASSSLHIVTYRSRANFTAPSVLLENLNSPKIVFAANDTRTNYGCLLAQSIFGKIPTAQAANTKRYYNVEAFTQDGNKLHTDIAVAPKHTPIDLMSSSSFAFKAMPLSVNVNGRLGVLWIAQEVKHDSAKDHASDFPTKDGTTAQSYVAGTTYRITGMELDYIVTCHNTGTTHVFNSFTPDGKGNYLSDGGTVYFTDWDGNGYGDNGTFTVGDNVAVITDDNENSIVRATHLQMTQYLYTEGM